MRLSARRRLWEVSRVASQQEVSVFDVVEYIRHRLPESTPLERHKLAYYVQGWHVTWEGVPLFPERIEAWAHGPVVREVWVADTYSTGTSVRRSYEP